MHDDTPLTMTRTQWAAGQGFFIPEYYTPTENHLFTSLIADQKEMQRPRPKIPKPL